MPSYKQIRQLTDTEIAMVENILQKYGVFCTPIFVKTPRSPPRTFGSARGTLSIVQSQGRVFMVTAAHVVQDNIGNLAFSPIGPGWRSMELNGYDWRYLNQNENTWAPDIDIDLAVAELSPTESALIDPMRIQPMLPASDYANPFVALISGYLNKKHDRRAIEIRARAKPTSYAVVSNGIQPVIRPPRAKPDPPIHVTFPFNRGDVPYWEQRDRVVNSNNAPQPNGLSGGPLLFCGSRENEALNRSPVVIGFLIEQSDRDGTITAVSSDVLYRAVGPIAKQ